MLEQSFCQLKVVVFSVAIPEDTVSDNDMHEDTPDERINREYDMLFV